MLGDMCRPNHVGNVVLGCLVAAFVYLPIPFAAHTATQGLGLPVVPVREVLLRVVPLIVGLAIGRRSLVASVAALIAASVLTGAQVTLVYGMRLSVPNYALWVGMAVAPLAVGAALGFTSHRASVRRRQSDLSLLP